MERLSLRCPKCYGGVIVPKNLGEIVNETAYDTGDNFSTDLPIAQQNLIATCDCDHVFQYYLVCIEDFITFCHNLNDFPSST